MNSPPLAVGKRGWLFCEGYRGALPLKLPRCSLIRALLHMFFDRLSAHGSRIRGHFFAQATSTQSTQKTTLPRYSWVYVRQYCAKIDEAARNRMKLIVRSLAEQNGVTEQLKAENQMEWVRQMNACKAQAEEVVKFELIYD